MKKCKSCNIEFNIEEKYCPLCQNILSGKSDDIVYPKNVRYKTNSIILKILLFLSSIIILLSSFLEYQLTKNIKISLYIGLSLITNYIIVNHMLKNYQNILKMFGKYGFLINFLLVLWFVLTKSFLITNYIIPSVCILELIFNVIVGLILRKNYLIKYSVQVLMSVILLITPMVFVILNLTTNNILSYTCCLLSIITIIGLLIFFKEDIKEELEKIFNLG